MTSSPSTCSTSKKNASSAPPAPAPPSAPRPNELIVSWNARGRASSSTPIASPSSTIARTGSVRTQLDHARQPARDVVQVAGVDPHLVARPVHLDARAVELPLDRRGPDLGQRGGDVGRARGEHRQDAASHLEPDGVEPAGTLR